jgi:hypothetical protein
LWGLEGFFSDRNSQEGNDMGGQKEESCETKPGRDSAMAAGCTPVLFEESIEVPPRLEVLQYLPLSVAGL